MTIVIPVWLLWTAVAFIGVPALLGLSFFAMIGYVTWRDLL